MILYWYMHWFWITITVNIIYCACDDVVATTAALQTSGSENGKAVTENPATQPARNYTQQDLSVIQPNNSLQQNFTYLNVTDVGFEVGNSSNETVIVTSERIGIELTETTGTLTGAGITGITLGCVTLVGLILLISFLLYRNRGLNRPQVLSDRSSNLDSSGYIDDNSVRDNSEEMYSLDNDSFFEQFGSNDHSKLLDGHGETHQVVVQLRDISTIAIIHKTGDALDYRPAIATTYD